MVVGSNFQYHGSEELSFVTGTLVMQNKCRITTPSTMPAGSYRISWAYEWKYTSTRKNFISRCRYDETDLNAFMYMSAIPMDSACWWTESGFWYTDSSFSGEHIIDLDYGTTDTGQTAYIRRARLEIWRMT